MHSPWGMIFNIIKETGWTWKYVMWGIRWINLQLMVADAPRFKTGKKKTKKASKADILNFFS